MEIIVVSESTMKTFSICRRTDQSVLFATQAESFENAVIAAVEAGQSLEGAYLRGLNFSQRDLEGYDFSGAIFYNVILENALCKKTNFSRCEFVCSNMKSIILCGANLSSAILYCVDLAFSDLTSINLENSKMRCVDLYGATLRAAKCEGMMLEETRIPARMLLAETVLRRYKHEQTPLIDLKDQIGPIRLYKLVNANGCAIFYPTIRYTIGETYTVNDVNSDESVECGSGINLGTLSWCVRNWKNNERILIAEFSRDDIACIPTGNDGRIRVRKCKIVGEKNLAELGLA